MRTWVHMRHSWRYHLRMHWRRPVLLRWIRTMVNRRLRLRIVPRRILYRLRSDSMRWRLHALRASLRMSRGGAFRLFWCFFAMLWRHRHGLCTFLWNLWRGLLHWLRFLHGFCLFCHFCFRWRSLARPWGCRSLGNWRCRAWRRRLRLGQLSSHRRKRVVWRDRDWLRRWRCSRCSPVEFRRRRGGPHCSRRRSRTGCFACLRCYNLRWFDFFRPLLLLFRCVLAVVFLVLVSFLRFGNFHTSFMCSSLLCRGDHVECR